MIVPKIPIYLVSNEFRSGVKIEAFLIEEAVSSSEEYYCYVSENKMYMMIKVTISGSSRTTRYCFGSNFTSDDWTNRASKTYQYPYLNGA